MEQLGKMLLYVIYYSRVDSTLGKARWLHKWMDSRQVIITINVLGIGVDILNIQIVVYIKAL